MKGFDQHLELCLDTAHFPEKNSGAHYNNNKILPHFLEQEGKRRNADLHTSLLILMEVLSSSVTLSFDQYSSPPSRQDSYQYSWEANDTIILSQRLEADSELLHESGKPERIFRK